MILKQVLKFCFVTINVNTLLWKLVSQGVTIHSNFSAEILRKLIKEPQLAEGKLNSHKSQLINEE